jgi:hypothetical protein
MNLSPTVSHTKVLDGAASGSPSRLRLWCGCRFIVPVLMSNRPKSPNHTLRLAWASSLAAINEFRSVGIQVI